MPVPPVDPANAVTIAITPPGASAPASPPPPAAKPATWPEWFGMVDLAIAVCVLIAAFGAGSYSAKNSDLWYHLAAGRLMTEGKYTFGVDPFSYMTEGRMWVNHNWLWDRLAYSLYQMDPSGAWLVAGKAIAFAAALLVVVLIRRPGGALWPWAVAAGMAVLAGDNYIHLRPFAFNALFLALTLFILFRLEWKPGSWRNPILLAVLMGIWANIDSCFVLGVGTILLVLVGEKIQALLLKGRVDEPGAFGPPPPSTGLIKALVLSMAFCTANPHHIHVWQMPAEYGMGLPTAGLLNDGEMLIAVLEPYSSRFWENANLGKNLNGALYLVMFLGSALSMAISFGRVRISHLLLWLLFAYLSLHQWLFILPFSIVAATIIGGYLNLLSSGIVLKSAGDPKTRGLLVGSGLGRLFSIILAALMVPAAWPGWLHGSALGYSANVRRVSWAIEPDEGLVNAAKVMQEWRKKGTLAPDVHGFVPTIDFANYLAYYAPDEKVFANGRYTFHAPEMPELLSSRQALYNDPAMTNEGLVDLVLVRNAMEKVGAKYLAAMGLYSRLDDNVTFAIERTPGWSVWYINGRGLVAGPDPLKQLTFDPATELLGSTVDSLPEILTIPPPPPRESWLDEFLDRPRTPPAVKDDAFALMNYANFLLQKANFEHGNLMVHAASVTGVPAVQLLQRKLNDDDLATPILAVRAARKAQAENPDLPDSYRALSLIYMNPYVVEVFSENVQLGRPSERNLQQVSALQRYLARVRKPEQCSKLEATQAYVACEQLLQIYHQSRQFDLCHELVEPTRKYFIQSIGIDYANAVIAAGPGTDKGKAIKAEFDGKIKRFEMMDQQLDKQISDSRERLKSSQLKGLQKFRALVQLGLTGSAITYFDELVDGDLQKENWQDMIVAGFQVIDYLTKAGKVERAVAQLDRLRKSIDELVKDPKTNQELIKLFKLQILEREYRLSCLEGNYHRAADALERANAGQFVPFSPAIIAAANTNVMDTALAFGYVAFSLTKQNSMIVNRALADESEFAYSRAVLAVFDGKPTEARERFVQSLSPQGVRGIPYPWLPTTERFIAMIDRVRKKK